MIDHGKSFIWLRRIVVTFKIWIACTKFKKNPEANWLKGKFDAKLSKTAAAWLNVQTMFYSLKGIQKHTLKLWTLVL